MRSHWSGVARRLSPLLEKRDCHSRGTVQRWNGEYEETETGYRADETRGDHGDMTSSLKNRNRAITESFKAKTLEVWKPGLPHVASPTLTNESIPQKADHPNRETRPSLGQTNNWTASCLVSDLDARWRASQITNW